MNKEDQEFYQFFIGNPNNVTINSNLSIILNHSESNNCENFPCYTCKFKDAPDCGVSARGNRPELYKALTEYFSEHYPEKLI